MKRVIKRIHHFTKKELAAEEIVLIIALCIIFATAAAAAQVLMPIRTNLISCGHRQDLPEACRRDQRCCALMEQSSADADMVPDATGDDGDSTGLPEIQEAPPPIEVPLKSGVTFE